MSKQVLVIGLGQFGRSLARALVQQGAEVIGVDCEEARVQEMAAHVTETMCFDAMDENALSAIAPGRRDISVCAIGDENREASIIVTALLKQLGAKTLIARATDPLHARILHLVGATEVVHPEAQFGERLAVRLAWHNVIEMLPLGDDLVLTEIPVPEAFVGRTLAELQLPRRHSITVAAVQQHTERGSVTRTPDPDRKLEATDTLMLVGATDAARRLTERF